eukprot:1082985-Pyramimonas_sp.AAC.1
MGGFDRALDATNRKGRIRQCAPPGFQSERATGLPVLSGAWVVGESESRWITDGRDGLRTVEMNYG